MALGGGTWMTQNKVLPGTYINFTSRAKASATLSDRGYAAAPFALSWGPEGEVFAVTAGEFQTNSMKIFGYAYDRPEMLPLREIFMHATTVYCWRLGTGKKASCDFAEAKYAGVRGNDLKIVVAANADDTEMWDISTYLDGTCVDAQTVTKATELVSNEYVTFKASAALAATTGVSLTGGADATVTGADHQAFLNAIEAYAFNTLCCPVADATTVKLYNTYTKRMRDEIGAKFQLVAWQPNADYEGVIGVWNTATHANIENVDAHSLVYWMAGAQAGVAVNASLTNSKYDGELIVNTKYTQVELEAAIKAGKCMFHSVNGVTRVLADINTLVTLSDTKGEVFQSNQTMRVCDLFANDVAVLFNTRYVGIVPNDAPGRAHLWNNIVKIVRELEKLRAVENFDPDILTCAQGESKGAVVCNVDGLDIINAMDKLYMSVIIQ